MQKISVLLLAQNSQSYLRRCLDSLVRFDEVVLVDGGSSDETIKIAKEYKNVVVYENSWPGFIEQRNFSISKASHSWCFMIDSDEMVTSELVDEIYHCVNTNPDKVMYSVCRTEYFLGHAIDSGHGKSGWQERLFITKRVTNTGGVHHVHLVDGQPIGEQPSKHGYLLESARVLHDDTYGLDDWIKKVPRFTLLIANEKYGKGKRVGPLEVLLTLFLTFFQIYFKSWRLGQIGFIISVKTSIFRALIKLIIFEKTHIGFSNKKDVKTQYLG